MLAVVAYRKSSLAQHLANLVDGSILAIGTGRLDDLGWRWWRVVFLFRGLQLCCRLDLEIVGALRKGISISRGQCLHVDAASGCHFLLDGVGNRTGSATRLELEMD